MQCPTCGKTIPDDSRHCAYCGAATRPSPRRKGLSAWVIPLLLLLGMGGGLGLGFSLLPEPTPQVIEKVIKATVIVEVEKIVEVTKEVEKIVMVTVPAPTPQVIEKVVTVLLTAPAGVPLGASLTVTPIPSARPGATPEPLSTPVERSELTATAAMATIQALTRVPTRTPTPTATNTPTPDATATVAVAYVRAVATATALGRDAADVYLNPKDLAVYLHVPAGEFPMGSSDADAEAEGDEKPQHTVTLDGFWIMQTEVTNAQYRQCVQDGTCRAPTTCDWGDPTYGDSSKADHPVVCVSWQDAQAYCEWAGARLPTEAEWEKAARGADGSKYPWGDSAPDCDKAQYSACGGTTIPVGSKPAGASPYGALDMAGNVWEWCQDWHGSDYYAVSPPDDPQGPDSGDYRVVRGGSWGDSGGVVRAAARGRDDPDKRHSYVGFRCVSLAP